MFSFVFKGGLILFTLFLSVVGAAAAWAVPSALVAAIPVLLFETAPLTSFLSVWLPLSVFFGSAAMSVGFIVDLLSEAR